MSKTSSFPPFSPAKGKGPVLLDPAFEFEAPRYCDLQDDQYDFYEDYEKNMWFEETHWLHEPPEKRPQSNRSKRKSVMPSFAEAAAVAKRQLTALLGEGSVDIAKLRCVTTRGDDESSGKTEDEKGRIGSFEREANFSPSRVFAPISDNVDNEALKRARFGAMNSPAKLRGPGRILFRRDSNKENFENQAEDENAEITKNRKSSPFGGRISDGKEENAEIGSRTSGEPDGKGKVSLDGKVTKTGKEEKAKASLEGKTAKTGKEKAKTSLETKDKSRVSGGEEKGTRKSGDGKAPEKARKSGLKEVEEKETSGRNSGGTNTLRAAKKVEKGEEEESQKQKIMARKSISVHKVEKVEKIEKVTRVGKVEVEKTDRITKVVKADKTSKVTRAGKAEKDEGEKEERGKEGREEKGKENERKAEGGEQKEKERESKTEGEQKIRARKSISTQSLAFLNAHSTMYSAPIPSSDLPPPSLLPPSSSYPHALPPQKLRSPPKKLRPEPPAISSTLPFFDAVKCVTSLPTRVPVDENEEEDEEERERESEREREEAEREREREESRGEGEGRREKEGSGKRKSEEALAGEKPKRTRSSIMTCPVPVKKVQKKVAPVTEKPNPPPAPKEKKITKTKRKSAEFEFDEDMAALLEKHNKKFKPAVAYVPRNFSTKDVKMWEEFSGKKWYSLTAPEREEANDWIKHAKAQMQNY
eukprot:Phypoly_transcript_04293.p1 GENE.Phypoly_transcript_04293~~Phypoly_transcript_04293.p1  ORF type:complete len:701 (-),score=216.34 Phypoly_transcript_04293:28-2130(-)